MHDFKNKYYKYKNKYLQLKKQSGGKPIDETLYINNKPKMGIINNEYALDKIHTFRQIRDKSTDSVVDVLFKYDYYDNNDNNELRTYKRNFFLMFVNDYFNLHIKAEFETYLINNDLKIFDKDEYVEFIFKGGNIYFENILRIYKAALCSTNLTNDNKNELASFFNSNFSVSDFDFVISLKCNNHKKYNKTKLWLMRFTIIKLTELTDFFNKYLTNELNTDSFEKNNGSYTITNNLLEKITDIQSNTTHYTNNLISKIGFKPDNIISEKDHELNETILQFSELYNNHFFHDFMVYIQRNNNIELLNLEKDARIECANCVSNINSEIIEPIIMNMINNINCINEWINANKVLIPTNNNIYTAKCIDIISKLALINDKYIMIFVDIPSIEILKDRQTFYLDSLKEHFTDIKFYSDNIFISILNNITKKLNDLSCDIITPEQPMPKITNLSYHNDTQEQTHPNIAIYNMNKIRLKLLKTNSNEHKKHDNSPKKFVKESIDDKFLFNNNEDYTNDNNYKIVKLKSNCRENIDICDISINSTKNFIIIADIEKDTKSDEEKDDNYHYVSFTSNISNKSNTSIMGFDLLRSKLNFKLNNVLFYKYGVVDIKKEINIPSEFIDISFSDYNDELYESSFKYKKIPFKLSNPYDFEIKTYQINYFVHDLQAILFNYNVYPWLDNKYSKRLKRLFFLYTISSDTFEKQKKLGYLLKIYIISSLMYNDIINNIDNICSDDKLIIDSILTYNDDEFYNLCKIIVSQELNIKNITFCSHCLLHNQLDDLVNNLMFIYQFYRVYNKCNDYKDDLYRLVNHIRRIYSYLPYQNKNNFIDSYYNKIPEYILNIINSIIEVYNCGNIMINI
jgi:hypothetical protein